MKLSLKSYLNFYKSNLINTLENIPTEDLEKITNCLLTKIKNKKNIFTAGNGGSAAIANHFLCDFNKGIKESSRHKLKPRVYSLSTNIELITAISNDLNNNKIFSFQLENLKNKGDVLVVFSCSGVSKNILNLLSFAKSKKILTIGFLGFAPRFVEKKFDYFINLGIKNYGITEDIFQMLMHLISQYIRQKSIINFNPKKNIL
tara:strand:- start:573 stop:1181 length:609 start_codon:yes stop_codon:yes gene_type:complete